MIDAELVFTALAEFSAREAAESKKAIGLPENKVAGKIGGGVAKKARIYLEKKTSKKVISAKKNLEIQNQKVLKEKNKFNYFFFKLLIASKTIIIPVINQNVT